MNQEPHYLPNYAREKVDAFTARVLALEDSETRYRASMLLDLSRPDEEYARMIGLFTQNEGDKECTSQGFITGTTTVQAMRALVKLHNVLHLDASKVK